MNIDMKNAFAPSSSNCPNAAPQTNVNAHNIIHISCVISNIFIPFIVVNIDVDNTKIKSNLN